MPLAAIAGIGAIGSIASGIIGSNAAGHAADTQAAAANNAANLQAQSARQALDFNKLQYGNSLAVSSPFINTALSANGRLGFLMGLNPGQGLPPGVTNPNAPQNVGNGFNPNAGTPFSNNPLKGGGDGITPGGNRLALFAQNASMLQPGQNPFGPSNGVPIPTGNPGTAPFNMNPPITSPGTGAPHNPFIQTGSSTGGAAGLLGANGQPQPEPQQPGLGAIGNPGDPSPYGPGGMGNIGSPTPQTASGAPGTVPQTGGNTLSLNPPINGTGEAMFNPNDPNQGLSPDGSAPNGGTFGSLAQGWGKTFNNPTGVTEQNDPGYQFRLQQGQQALQNSAAARGGLLSGGTAKALTDYNQNAASGEYGNVYNRALQNYNTNYNTFTNDQTNIFNRLMGLQSGGQTSANNLSASGITAAQNAANIGLTSAGQIGQQINNAGAANASGYINSANAINGAIGGASNSLSTLALLRQLQGQGAGA